MKASYMPFHHLLCYIHMALFWSISLDSLAQTSLIDYVNYEVVPVCSNPADGKPAEQGSFFIKCDFYDTDLKEGGQQENFEISIEGVDLLQFYVDPNQLPYSVVFGPFQIPPENQERSISIALESIDNGSKDNLYVDEVLCGIETNNGLNQPGYICTTDDQYIFAQAQPLPLHGGRSSSSSTYVYVLTDETGLIQGYNQTGLFNQEMSDGELTIELFSIANHELSSFTSQLEIDESLGIITESSCYASCGTYSLDFSCVDFDLALTKRVVGGPIFSIGDTVEYLISVINQGSVPAFDILVRDIIPDGLSYVTDMNDNWDVNAESMPIEVIAPEDSLVLSIQMIIENPASFSSILNVAEIIFATDEDGDDEPAFDQDSTPDNEDPKEDDIDEVEILVLEALCDFSFDFIIEDNRPYCDGKDIDVVVIASSDNGPISYTWTLNGDTVSRSEMLSIDNPQDEDFGTYMFTISDMMNCGGSYEVVVEPILEERVSCINDINLTVGADCSLRLSPSMLTLNNISGINDYVLEVVDRQGSIVNLDDVSSFDLSEPLEVKLMHPCTGQTLCWSFVNAEYKSTPRLNFYQDTVELICAQLESSELIKALEADELILDSMGFDSLMTEQLCSAEGKLLIDDQIFERISCGSGLIGRIYSLSTMRGTFALDTAIIKIDPLNIGLIQFPEDLANLSCNDGYDPQDIGSIPILINDGDSIPILINEDHSVNICQVVASFTDQSDDNICAFGSRKILRQWSIVDWCTDIVRDHTQHIYIVDKEAPTITTTTDTIIVTLAGRSCDGDIDLSSYVVVSDLCDSDPDIIIGDYSSDRLFIQDISSGIHDISIEVTDACGNVSQDTIHVLVKEEVPPIPITTTELNLSFTTESSSWLTADLFDINSADACGPITVQIARASEIYQITSNGDLSVWELRDKCGEDLSGEDENNDGEITVSEIFRDQIFFCCGDLGQRLKVIVRISDQFGNYAETDAWVNVVTKEESVSCDDGDPCTIGDSMIEGCPCKGQIDVSDLDEDGIPDCIDQDFIICIDGETTSIDRVQIEELLALGATPGPCEFNELADIGGEVFTMTGDMIEDVLISSNTEQETYTNIDGQYAFKANEMYLSYEIEAYKNDDPLNGVSALDMVMIQKYLLGIEDISDLDKLIAADINGDGKVSAVDLAELRKLLLGQTNDFAHNTSWVFIPADPGLKESDPFYYEERIVIEELALHRMDEDWIGIKIGDLSGNAITNKNKASSRSDFNKVIQIPSIELIEGEEAIIPISLVEPIDLSALQISLMGEFEVIGLVSNQIEFNSEDYRITPTLDTINMVWTDPNAISVSDGSLISLIVSPHRSGSIDEAIRLNGQFFNRLYDNNKNSYSVALEFIDKELTDPDQSDNMFQNEPNPFIDYTTIPIYLSDTKSVSLRFYTRDGRLLHEHKNAYEEGNHQIVIDRKVLGQISGQVFYELSTDDIRLVRSMISVTK